MTRATPLPADERREAILTAALPLFLGCGGNDLSTRQIAEAAGVAEGTLFRAFDSKTAIIDALIERALDTTQVCEAIVAVDREQDLPDRLTACFELLIERMRTTTRLFIALMSREIHGGHRRHDPQVEASRSAAIRAAIIDVIGDDADQLGVPAEFAAEYLRATAFASAHPSFAPILTSNDDPASAPASEIVPRPHRDAVHCLLYGMLLQKESAC